MDKMKLLALTLFFLIVFLVDAEAKPIITIHSPLNQTYLNGTAKVNITLSETANITLELNGAKVKESNVSELNTYIYGNETFFLKVYAENENGSDTKNVTFTVKDGTHSVTINSCGILGTSTTYYLNQSITDYSGSCMRVRAENVTLDCMGHTIDGTKGSSTYGVDITANNTNFVLKNCTVRQFGYGVGWVDWGMWGGIDANGTVLDSVIEDNRRYGVTVATYDAHRFSIINTNFTGNDQDSIHLYDAYFKYVNIANCYADSLVTIRTQYSNITNNTFATDVSLGGSYFNFMNNTIENFKVEHVLGANNKYMYNKIYRLELRDGNATIYGNDISIYRLLTINYHDRWIIVKSNFTDGRQIYLSIGYPNQWFIYYNESGGVGLETSTNTSTTITRKLINWNQDLVEWNDSANNIQAYYILRNLMPNSEYRIYDNDAFVESKTTDQNGNLEFNITLSSEHAIKVVRSYIYVTFNYSHVNFGTLSQGTNNNTALNQENGIYNVTVNSSSEYEVLANGTDFISGSHSFAINNLRMGINESASNLSLSDSVELTGSETVIKSNIPKSITNNFHGFWLSIPPYQYATVYNSTITITYRVV